jgi:hypothetical protein
MTEIVAFISLGISAITAWLTLLQKGELRMTRPTLLCFVPYSSDGVPKLFFRTLLYSTSKRGQIIEDMFVILRNADTSQNFTIWAYGDASIGLVRGSGLKVGEEGIAVNHHFLLPNDGSTYKFLTGEYVVEIYASLVNKQPNLLHTTQVSVSTNDAEQLNEPNNVIFFDWRPDARLYVSHIDAQPMRGRELESFSEMMRPLILASKTEKDEAKQTQKS